MIELFRPTSRANRNHPSRKALASRCKSDLKRFLLSSTSSTSKYPPEIWRWQAVARSTASSMEDIQRDSIRRTWIQPAAGDEGCHWRRPLRLPLRSQAPRKHNEERLSGAIVLGSPYRSRSSPSIWNIALEREPLLEEVAEHLASGSVVGWCSGENGMGTTGMAPFDSGHPAC